MRSFFRLAPAFRAYVKPRLRPLPYVRATARGVRAGLMAPRLLPRVYVNVKPRAGLWRFWTWRGRKGDADESEGGPC